MSRTIEKTATQKDIQRAEDLMNIFAQSYANKKALQESIKNEVKAYDKNMEEAEKELLEIGKRNRVAFDKDGNLVLENGYLHIADKTVVLTGKNFDLTTFQEVHPGMVDIKFKVDLIKKAYKHRLLRKDLNKLGIELGTKEEMQVLVKNRR